MGHFNPWENVMLTLIVILWIAFAILYPETIGWTIMLAPVIIVGMIVGVLLL